MTRIARPSRDELDEKQRVLYDKIAGGPRAVNPGASLLGDSGGPLGGPFNAMLLAPEIGDAIQELGAAIRFRGTLTERAREIAILTVAAYRDSAFEQRGHEAIGARIGLSTDELSALRAQTGAGFSDPVEAAVLATTRALLANEDLDDGQYEAATTALGAAGLFELSALVGYYSLLAVQLRVYRVS